MSEFNNFRNKTLKEIRLWAWAAAVLPITALAGIFFVWSFGTKTLFDISMIIGETVMFGTAVGWWWWALYVMKKLLGQWDTTRKNVGEVLTEVKEVRDIIKDINSIRRDK